jgi:hypothetical protein
MTAAVVAPAAGFAGKELLKALLSWKGAAALTGLTIGADALGQLNRKDPVSGQSEPGGQNIAGGLGSLGGGTAGAIAGGALLAPVGLAPLGIGVGGWLGSMAGGSAARGTTRAVGDMFAPSELEKQIRDGERMNAALRTERMRTIPVSEAEGYSANRLERDRMQNVLAMEQRRSQQQALLAAALAGSARPLTPDPFGPALMAATSGLRFG